MAWSTLDIGAYKQVGGGPTTVTATGSVTGQSATTTGQVNTPQESIAATGSVTGQSATTTGQVVVPIEVVTVTGNPLAQPAVSTGQIFAYNQINATGNALAQPAVTTGQVKVFAEITATGDAQADPAVTTGQVTVTGVVVVTGAVDGQPATTTGLTETSGFLLATGAVTGQPATTTGQILIVEPVQASGSPQAQPATTTGLVEISGNTVEATGNALAQAATATGSVFVIVEITATGDVAAQAAVTTGQARVPLLGPFDIRMKAPDGEWVEINTHDSQLGINPDNHHPQLHDLTSHTDVNAPAPTSRDGVFWDGAEYVNDKRMNWVFPYVEGGPWIKDDTSRDGIFSGIANKDTTDPLGPVPTGVPFWPTDGVPLYNNLFQLLGVKVGNVFTMANEGLINSARINIPLENISLLVTASIHINDVQIVETTYVPRVEGMHIYNIAPVYVFTGDVVRIEVDTIKQTGNTQVHYLQAPAYWATYSDPMFSSVQGLFDEVPDTNAYEIDMEFQVADVSADWDILAVSNATLQADNNPINTRETTWVQTSTDNLEKFEVSTTDMAWTEIGRYPIADLSAVRGTAWVTATRTDGTLEGFYYESRALIYRDGTITVQTQEICKLTPHPTVDFRSTVVGNDLVFEVRGSAIIAQAWDWKMIYFVRDIT